MTATEQPTAKPWFKRWWVWAIVALVIVSGAVNAATGDDEQSKAEPTTSAPVETPTVEPAPEPEPEEPAEAEPALDEIKAAQHLALAWEDRMTYGGTVHWIADRITTANEDGTYTFKIGATIENAYGNKSGGTIEGDVGGTTDTPEILDSILYTDTGEIINYYE